MGREGVDREMKEILGTMLASFDRIPDEFVDSEWDLVKRVQFGETLIPKKYKELIGLAVAAISRCRYAITMHSELARLYGATEAELAEAIHYAQLVSGWSIQLNGLLVDQGEFAREVEHLVAFPEERHREQIAMVRPQRRSLPRPLAFRSRRGAGR